MNEFFYSNIAVIDIMTEEERESYMALYKHEPDLNREIVKCKVSLKDIRCIFQSDTDELCIHYQNGDKLWIIDRYERVDKLHEEYLQSLNKSFLIKAQ